MTYRIGRKQKRAILTEDGHEVVVFAKGKEDMAELVCRLLNEHSANTPVVKSVCDVCGSDDVIEAPHMGKNCNSCHPL